MLDTKLTVADFDYAYQRQAEYEESQPLTIFAGRKPLLRDTPVLSDGGISIPWDERNNPVDKYTPQDDDYGTNFNTKPLQVSDRFSRTMDVPIALGLGLTDKDSRGVFETKPLRREPNPVNATLLNNPAVEGLETVNFGGSPLGNSYSGYQSIASGSDPAEFFANATTPYQFVEDEVAPVEEADAPCGMFDFPCKFSKVKGEATILIVGVLILGLGIFALTR